MEAPELLHVGDWYYLFFAAGQYCQNSYSEGVARALSVYGPYEKLGVPLLSTGIVGRVAGAKLIGPGHASFLQEKQEQRTAAAAAATQWFSVWHASLGSNCVRYPFITRLQLGSAGWPYIEFQDQNPLQLRKQTSRQNHLNFTSNLL